MAMTIALAAAELVYYLVEGAAGVEERDLAAHRLEVVPVAVLHAVAERQVELLQAHVRPGQVRQGRLRANLARFVRPGQRVGRADVARAAQDVEVHAFPAPEQGPVPGRAIPRERHNRERRHVRRPRRRVSLPC